jgi:biotin carboxylase
VGDISELAVVCPESVPALQLRRAAAGRWRYVWLVDRRRPHIEDQLRLLRRLGTVVDMTDMSPQQTVAVLEPRRLRGVMALVDDDLALAASLAASLGLPGYSPETVGRLTSKLLQRKALQRAGVPVPAFWTIPGDATLDDVTVLAGQVRFPVVIKPVNGAGSRDTYPASSPAELVDVVRIRMRASQAIIVEEFLQDSWRRSDRPYADFLSVESILTSSGISHLGVIGRDPLEEPFRETGSFLPACLDQLELEQVLEMAGRAVAAMDASSGVFHTELKLTPNGPRVIEINGRPGGLSNQLLEAATGVSLLALASQVALGEPVVLDGPLACSGIAFEVVIVPPQAANRVSAFCGLEQVGGLPCVDAVSVLRDVGDEVDWREGWTSRVLSVDGIVADYPELWATKAKILDLVRVSYDVSIEDPVSP